MIVKSNLASIRLKRGTGATALAQAAGVSRQTIYSIETGAFMPNTAVALRLAKFLRVNVEDLFSIEETFEPAAETIAARLITGGKLVYPGQPVQLSRVGDETIAVPEQAHAEMFSASVNGVVVEGNHAGGTSIRVEVLDDTKVRNSLIVAGCDPAVMLLAEPLQKAGIQLVPWFSNSETAVELLKAGCVHMAGCHMHGHSSRESNTEFARKFFAADEIALIDFIGWEQGLLVSRGNPKKIRRIDDLARKDVRMINREPGSGTRRLLDDLLGAHGIEPSSLRGYEDVAQGHMAVALSVFQGRADCGLSINSAARMAGLTFVPLRSERYDFVVTREQKDTKQVRILLDELNRAAVRTKLETVCGYDAKSSGNIVVA